MNKTKKQAGMDKVPSKAELFSVLGFTDAEFEKLAEDIWGNFPEASQGSALVCVSIPPLDKKTIRYTTWVFGFKDTESEEAPNKVHYTDREKCLGAVASFLVLKLRGQLKGIEINDYHDAGDYDAIAADAIAQLAILGDVIYG